MEVAVKRPSAILFCVTWVIELHRRIPTIETAPVGVSIKRLSSFVHASAVSMIALWAWLALFRLMVMLRWKALKIIVNVATNTTRTYPINWCLSKQQSDFAAFYWKKGTVKPINLEEVSRHWV